MTNTDDIKFRTKPLCLDLDGTLIATDSLAESLIVMIKTKPLYFFLLPLWILRGKYYFKSKIEQNSRLSPDKLPYIMQVLDFAKAEKAKGRMIVLATATMQGIADKIADYLGIFDLVIGSKDGINLRSTHKRDKLVELFGEKGFDYAGDSKADFKVWQSANKAIVVHPNNSVLNKAKSIGNVDKVFKEDFSVAKAYIKQIRVYQWIKNILLFLPFIMAHKLFDVNIIQNVLVGFFSFSFLASFVYVLNDLMDLEADRIHPRKKYRPLASGKITLFRAFALLPLLLISSFSLAIAFLPFSFTIIMLCYAFTNIVYSIYAKKVMILDIIILSSFYTLRIIAGAIAAGVVVSPWLIEFSIFFFFSLAAVKRFSELFNLKELNQTSAKRRGYLVTDLDLVRNFGVISGYISVLIIAFYVHSDAVVLLYKRPEILWAISPCLLYWISRIWLLAHRGLMNEDPIVFTGKDKVSYIVGIVIVIVAIIATI